MKIILFDIDGTLLLTGRAGQGAIQTTVRELYGIEKLADVKIQGQTDRGIARELFAAHDLEDSDENWQTFRECYAKNLEKELPQRDGYVLPGVREILEQLDAREDAILGLLTGNIEKGARLKLEHYDLMHFFSFGGYGDHHPVRDDVARTAKENAEQELGRQVAPDSIWVIGDTPNDIRCAKAIGARVLAVGTGGVELPELDSHDPDHCTADLSDVDRVVDLFLNGSASGTR